ncbi:L-azetidine-2-carboxylic acid acetyltransferase [Sphaceloma murrayae]|uniref:L-azetidine-2-carboxylic acid acetyltransferase n=1 Tax=Sphaceloma murrayae TaxID=2082308 RepID=A0A2K1R218_9PEZI|nr:L-azetidine-2-carboxylic acid acetyltransferase [Sphaceloma murrayae]
MPAMLDDPTAPAIYRTSGDPPYPTPASGLPSSFSARHITLRDQSVGTLIPFASSSPVPAGLLARLAAILNSEIEGGNTYPMITTMDDSKFAQYWFANFAAVMVQGALDLGAGNEGVYGQLAAMERLGEDWTKTCLGTYYIKPNYPGRSSHVCNAGFLVSENTRGKGVGRSMGETYIGWAPMLVWFEPQLSPSAASASPFTPQTLDQSRGYKYSIFNLVYETNTASLRIWDALSFQRVGRVKGAAALRSYPDRLVDAIVYGRDLSVDEEAYKPPTQGIVTEADRTRKWWARLSFYLKTKTYPADADASEQEKMRRCAARQYWAAAEDGRPEGRIMVRCKKGDKEFVWHEERQKDVARTVHEQEHININAVCDAVGKKYRWPRIKETVQAVVRSCEVCNAKGGAKRRFIRKQGPRKRVKTMYPRADLDDTAGTRVPMRIEMPGVYPGFDTDPNPWASCDRFRSTAEEETENLQAKAKDLPPIFLPMPTRSSERVRQQLRSAQPAGFRAAPGPRALPGPRATPRLSGGGRLALPGAKPHESVPISRSASSSSVVTPGPSCRIDTPGPQLFSNADAVIPDEIQLPDEYFDIDMLTVEDGNGMGALKSEASMPTPMSMASPMVAYRGMEEGEAQDVDFEDLFGSDVGDEVQGEDAAAMQVQDGWCAIDENDEQYSDDDDGDALEDLLAAAMEDGEGDVAIEADGAQNTVGEKRQGNDATMGARQSRGMVEDFESDAVDDEMACG